MFSGFREYDNTQRFMCLPHVTGSAQVGHTLGLNLQSRLLNAHICCLCLHFNSINECILKILGCRQSYRYFTETANIALNKTAFMSSALHDRRLDFGPASTAVDGDTDGYDKAGSCVHTGKEVDPWWAVDLGLVISIFEVEISNRIIYKPGMTYLYVAFVNNII